MFNDSNKTTDELIKFNPVYTSAAAIRKAMSHEVDQPLSDFIDKIMLLSTYFGLNSVSTILNTIGENANTISATQKEELNKRIKIFSTKGDIPGAEKPATAHVIPENVTTIIMNDPVAGPGTRGMSDFELFMNSIPTYEMSRAVPYIEVRMQEREYTDVKSKNPSRLSLIKFLSDGTSMGSVGADGVMTGIANGGDVEAIRADGPLSFTNNPFANGMELFLSPQTLVNLDANDDVTSENGKVIDPFRPIMSVLGFKAQSTASTLDEGLNTEVGELQLVLYHRSHLDNITALLAPFKTQLNITFGWRHPDGPEQNNPYADLINRIYSTGLWNVSSFSFSLEPNGEVKITLKVSGMGSASAQQLRILDSNKAMLVTEDAYVDMVKEMIEKIEEQENKKDESKKKVGKITIEHVIKRNNNTEPIKKEAGDRIMAFYKKHVTAKKKIAVGKKNVEPETISKSDLIALVADLEKLIGVAGDGSDGEKSSQKVANLMTVDTEVNKKFDDLLNPEDQPKIRDSYMPSFLSPDAKKNKNLGEPSDKQYGPDFAGGQYISLGKFLESFVGPALVSDRGTASEVELVYFPFNEDAGKAAGLSTASFMFHHENLKKAFRKFAAEKKTVNVLLYEIMQFAMQQMNDDKQEFYGVAPPPLAVTNKPGVQSKMAVKAKKEEGAPIIASSKAAGILKQSFRCPRVECSILSKPSISSGSDHGTMKYRIEVFDREAEPFSGIATMFEAAMMGSYSDKKSTRSQVVAQALADGIITEGPGGVITLNTDSRSMIDYLKQLMPSVTYGSNASMVINASMQSIPADSANAVGLEASIKDTGDPPGSFARYLDIIASATKLSTTIFGFPRMWPMTSALWDFQTGTSLDQVYSVISYVHEITPGKFTTQVEWAPQPGVTRAWKGPLGVTQQLLNKAKIALEEPQVAQDDSAKKKQQSAANSAAKAKQNKAKKDAEQRANDAEFVRRGGIITTA